MTPFTQWHRSGLCRFKDSGWGDVGSPNLFLTWLIFYVCLFLVCLNVDINFYMHIFINWVWCRAWLTDTARSPHSQEPVSVTRQRMVSFTSYKDHPRFWERSLEWVDEPEVAGQEVFWRALKTVELIQGIHLDVCATFPVWECEGIWRNWVWRREDAAEAHMAHMAGIGREGVTTGLLKCLKCAKSWEKNTITRVKQATRMFLNSDLHQ